MAFRASPRTKTLLAGLSALIALSAPVRAAEPSPAAIENANKLILDLGLKQSLDVVVPALFGEFEKNVLATRPELKDPLHQALLVLVPEFNKGEPAVLADVARVMATKLSESELKEVVAFYESPTGKKYVAAEPAFIDELQSAGSAWRQKLAERTCAPRARGNEEEGRRLLTSRAAALQTRSLTVADRVGSARLTLGK